MRNSPVFGRGLAGLSVILLLSFLLQACGRQLEPQKSCNFVTSSQQQRVSWKGQLPVRFYVHQSVPPEYYSAIERAAERWNAVHPQQELFSLEAFGTTGVETPQRDGYSVIYWRDAWDASRPLEQARTTIHWAGTQILEADIAINAQNHQFFASEDVSTFANGYIDLESLMIHEFGHALGLAHINEVDTVMAENLSPGQSRRELGGIDLASLLCEY